MKKAISLLLTLVLCLSLCACGGGEASESPYEKYAKYEELFGYLETNDYDNANAYVQNFFGITEEAVKADENDSENTESEPVENEPVETEPKPVTVEITMDNWQDYFELREYTEFKENGFGEIDDAKTYWSVVNKDEYVINEEACDVTFEYTCDWEDVKATIDVETKEVVYGETTGSSTSEPEVETMGNVGQYIGENTHDRYGAYLNGEFFDVEDGKLVSVFDRRMVNVNVLRISGTFSYFE